MILETILLVVILAKVEKHFGSLTIQRGPDYDFLGMNIKFLDNKSVEINMTPQIKDAIESFGEVITKKAVTPATRDLHLIREEAEEDRCRAVLQSQPAAS